jgi:hypothetical protein
MNNATLQIKFTQRLNKLASNDYDNIECWQIVEAFNKAQIEWCRRQLHGNNMYKEGDEASKRRIDDLQPLLTNQILIGSSNSEYFKGTNFPVNYLEYKRVSTDATNECCKEPRSMTVYLAEEANIDLIMRDPLKRPDFEWGETFCTLHSNNIKIYKRDFDIVDPVLTFYRKPVNIEIEGCIDPYTQLATVTDVECEFKDDIAEIIIDEAVAIIAGDIDAVNQYIRGSQYAEKNN